ncbi:prepilin-type N-terminal cleavage/methylation domain-containing protein [Pseudoalteromonas sp.]|uniref:PilW family protein n=1 Tax=Pseudoalteromonas sp. TaxID=53249 RepID=UPI0025FAB8FE|nr:prepilin-type N-terminal cleavage/methylation domain-containing protein [Pseudoalteromonas sp.]
MYCQTKARGFSLVEVLIAMVILFSFLAMMANTFSVTRKSSENAEGAAVLSLIFPLVKTKIISEIEREKLSSEGVLSVLNGVEYHWQAKLLKEQLSLTSLNSNTSKMVRLYQIDLKMTYLGYERTYNFEKVVNSEK